MSIEVRNISKTFGNHQALCRVNLYVPTGGLVALLGPSGSGKTTLLRIIAGLEQFDPPDYTDGEEIAGEIRFNDENVTRTHVRHRAVGFVFQHYALFRHMNVFENIAFGLRVRTRRDRPTKHEIRDRVHRLLELVQLEGFAQRYPNQLSGGQRQRVALARALAVEPNVLLLDEPFGALDAKVRKDLRCWLRRLHDELHVTSVFVTHDQDEALEVADQVVIMNSGRIEQIGTPHDVFHHPASEFVIDFLGQVNRFSGRIDSGIVRFETLAVSLDGEPDVETTEATVFVRPHDLTIDMNPSAGGSIPATIEKIHSAGETVRLELRTDRTQPLYAAISQERFGTMSLAEGGRVYIRPRHIRVFAR